MILKLYKYALLQTIALVGVRFHKTFSWFLVHMPFPLCIIGKTHWAIVTKVPILSGSFTMAPLMGFNISYVLVFVCANIGLIVCFSVDFSMLSEFPFGQEPFFTSRVHTYPVPCSKMYESVSVSITCKWKESLAPLVKTRKL